MKKHIELPCLLTFVGLTASLPNTGTATAGESAQNLDAVATPPTEGANRFYVSNRAPLLADPLIKLPIGSIRPEGWLRHQLLLMSRGMTGHLPELSQWCKRENSAWMSPKGQGEHGWEELPYWLKGFGDLGYVLGDERIIKEARDWIEAALASQEPDGYFGPRRNKQQHDCWPNMIMLNVLQSFHEATGDKRVLPFMSKYFRWQMELPREHLLPGSWQKIRGGDNLQSIYWLYNRTGEPWLLDVAKVIHERTANWTEGVPNWHGVNICQSFRGPGQYYQQTRDVRYLEAAERNYRTVMDLYGQVPGGMFGADENCRPGFGDPRQAAETCSIVEFMLSNEMLLKITGKVLYADRCEEIAFNSFPASQTPDLKALHYLTAPNMVQLDRQNKAPGLQNGGCMLAYNPWAYRCCQHNVSHGWPYYAEHLWLATRGNGLVAVLYAACQVKAKVGDGVEIAIQEETDYPFDEKVTFRLSSPRPVRFPLLLRIPGWCEAAGISLNGERLALRGKAPCYFAIDRTWNTGDVVQLELPMKIRVAVWKKNKDSVSVSRGPLTFSLKIGEKWVRYGGTDKWPAWEVYPTTPWNYGLLIDMKDPASSFQVVKKKGPLADQPFQPEHAPIELVAKAKRIPNWEMAGGLVGLLQQSPVRSDQPTGTVTLIPMGCARLRISAFPTIGRGPDAHEWTLPPPPRHTASFQHDDIRALSDGNVPKGSGDQTVPRFTWWNHLGTKEWVTYNFKAPRKVRFSEVYWFDDTGIGRCRVPASWKLFWKDGKKWRPVAGASGYGTRADTFNKVTFEAVETTSLRIEVQLQPGFSGGILEWRIGR